MNETLTLDEQLTSKIVNDNQSIILPVQYAITKDRRNTHNVVSEGIWRWPNAWHDLFPVLDSIRVLILSENREDKLNRNGWDGKGKVRDDIVKKVVIVNYAWKRWKNGTPSDMIDLTLNMGSAGSLQNIIRSIHIGLLCVQENVTDRPTMDSIVLMLSSLTILLPQPSEPAFLVHSIITDPEMPLPVEYSSFSGSSCLERPELSMINLRPSLVSVNDVTISEIVPR
ncbi:hypothetical protein Tco_1547850 [Tanacetum coccineum]